VAFRNVWSLAPPPKPPTIKYKIPRKYKPRVRVENVVASVTLNQRVDLEAIEEAFGDKVRYDPHEFPGLVFRLEHPKTATLIFNSGKMVCTGAKSEKQAHEAVYKTVEELRKQGIVIKGEPIIEIQNIVASADLHGTLDLEKIVYMLENTMYEPEQFPGLIYRMDEPRVVMLLFASGKLVCTGARTEADVYRAVELLQQQLIETETISYAKEVKEYNERLAKREKRKR